MKKKAVDPPKLNYENKDTLEYRFNECSKTGGLSLDISHLELTKLPPNIPITVKFLFCSENNLSVIDDLTFLSSLEVIDCGFNKLTKLPMFPKSIVEISSRNNALGDASTIKTINCPNLKRVDLSHNNLENIPRNGSIEQLIITNNKLKQLPA